MSSIATTPITSLAQLDPEGVHLDRLIDLAISRVGSIKSCNSLNMEELKTLVDYLEAGCDEEHAAFKSK